MGDRIKPIVGAWVTASVIAYLGVQNFFNSAMPDPPFSPMIDNAIAATAVFWIVTILFFDWAVQRTGKTMLTAMVIAISQILLVDFNYVLIGRRELQPALISVVIILAIWCAVATVYDKLSESS